MCRSSVSKFQPLTKSKTEGEGVGVGGEREELLTGGRSGA